MALNMGCTCTLGFGKGKPQQVNQLEEIVIELVSGAGPLPTLWIYILLLCTCCSRRSRDVTK